MTNTRVIALCGLLALFAIPLSADELASIPDFGFGIGLGTETLLDDPTAPLSASNEYSTWQTLSFKPDLKLGKFGVGLDLTVHFNIDLSTDSNGVDFYLPDWVPERAGMSFLELYLPKIQYLSWGEKGEPLYVKFGSFDDGTLGNGFIMGNYRNTAFMPANRFFGAALDIDGALFKFPWVGLETFAGNVSRLDLIGARIFVRPIIGMDLPIIKNLQVGTTFVADREPNIYDDDETNDDLGPAIVYGADFRLPVLNNALVSLVTFGDYVLQGEDARWGGMLGAGGRFLSFLTYGAQLRILGPDFIPTYFDAQYDLFRHLKYEALSTSGTDSAVSMGWLASLGTSLLEERIVFQAAMDGPFAAPPAVDSSIADYPHLRAILRVEEGLLAGFFFDAWYEKYYLGAPEALGGTGNFFEDLISPENAVIGANINYKTGPATLTLTYSLRYDPSNAASTNGFVITSSLYSSIQF